MTPLPPKLEEAIRRANGRTFAVSGEDMDAQIAEQVAANAALVAAIREYAADCIMDAFDCKACHGSGTQIIDCGDHAESDGCCDPQDYEYTMTRLSKRAQEIRDGK